MSDLDKGWIAVNCSQKWHYVRSGQSLCGRIHIHSSQSPPVSPKRGHIWNVNAYSESVDDPSKQCATCTEKLTSEQARAELAKIEAQKRDEKEKETIAAFFRDPPPAFTRDCKDCGQFVTVTTLEIINYLQQLRNGVSAKLVYGSALERGAVEREEINRLGVVSLTSKEAYRQYCFDVNGPKGVFCKTCRSLDWNPFRSKGRSTSANARWKLAVRRKDGNKCVQCGSRVSLDVHHIKPRATFPDLRYDVNNGQTLCANCHEEATYGKSYNRSFETTERPCVDCGIRNSRMRLYRKGSLERLSVIVPVIDVGIDRRLQFLIDNCGIGYVTREWRKEGYNDAEIEAMLKDHEEKLKCRNKLFEMERKRQISECDAVCANCHRLRLQKHRKQAACIRPT